MQPTPLKSSWAYQLNWIVKKLFFNFFEISFLLALDILPLWFSFLFGWLLSLTIVISSIHEFEIQIIESKCLNRILTWFIRLEQWFSTFLLSRHNFRIFKYITVAFSEFRGTPKCRGTLVENHWNISFNYCWIFSFRCCFCFIIPWIYYPLSLSLTLYV